MAVINRMERGNFMFEKGISEVLIPEEKIASIVNKMGEDISQHYEKNGGQLLVVGLLKGSFIFMADLIRRIRYPLAVDFMDVSSYGDGTESSGIVRIDQDLNESVEGKHVLLVEDIIDTGKTLHRVLEILESRSPKSLKVCTFISKPSRRTDEVPIDFCGVEIPDKFVCGYGLDYAQKYRNLPYVGVLSEK